MLKVLMAIHLQASWMQGFEQSDIVVFFGTEKSFNELAAFAAEHEVSLNP